MMYSWLRQTKYWLRYYTAFVLEVIFDPVNLAVALVLVCISILLLKGLSQLGKPL